MKTLWMSLFLLLCFASVACEADPVCVTQGNGSLKGHPDDGVAGSGGSGGSAGSAGDAPTGGTSVNSGVPVCPPSECSDFSGPIIGKQQCDDETGQTADRCITWDACGGKCVHLPVECDSLDPPNIWATVCDDGDKATADLCNYLNACTHAVTGTGT